MSARTHAKIEGRIVDVRDRNRVFQLLHEFKPDIVFHAAALKHVDPDTHALTREVLRQIESSNAGVFL
ncbi:polysaccharide biosynthesis protein [Bradyrhizobium liaoningense]|uniref:polysaccharide biosynthesis protein n=1 Tax=Bradyrhizobium liaoningense TaxID=43992 RepID=UPI00201240EF|nr:polysaccharide biosynthesis protein [Bradyrhizobium liaoningense]